MGATEFLACHDCDLLHRRVPLAEGARARCRRCGALLERSARDVVDRTLAYASASLVLFVVANVFPFLEFRVSGRAQVNHLASGVMTLLDGGYPFLAAMVAFTSVVAPLGMILTLLYLASSVRARRRAPFLREAAKLIDRIKPWSMMEVYLLGVIVSIVKLSSLADIVLGPACYAFAGLIFTLTAAIAVFDTHVVWERLPS